MSAVAAVCGITGTTDDRMAAVENGVARACGFDESSDLSDNWDEYCNLLDKDPKEIARRLRAYIKRERGKHGSAKA